MVEYQPPSSPLPEALWKMLPPHEQAKIVADIEALIARRQESSLPLTLQSTSQTQLRSLNLLEEMRVDRFLHDVGWSLADRNDQLLARSIAEGETVDAVYTLEDEAALDEFFHYLEVQGFIPLFERLANCMRIFRQGVPPVRYIFLYLVKILLGIEGMAKMSPVLLRDEGLMRLLGFNAQEIERGVTRRGDHRRGAGAHREGPVSSEAVAENIVKLSVFALADFFNHLIQRCTGLVIVENEVDLVIDCSDFETTEKCQGAGRVKRKRLVKGKSQSARETKAEVMVFGFKIGVAYHPPSGLPVAVCVTRINVHDGNLVETLLQDAAKNLPGKHIRGLTMDRGFLDGEYLWRLHERGIQFVIPLKRDMDMYKDARALAQLPLGGPQSPHVQVVRREEQRVEGYGKQATTRTLLTEVVGIARLETFHSYGPPGHADKKFNKDFKPNPLNAVVVREWRGRKFKDPAIFATNMDVSNPFQPFDRYDDRSRIENGVFRETKQDWSLERPPQKTEAGVTAHVYLTLAAMALQRCFRLQTETSAKAGGPTEENPRSEAVAATARQTGDSTKGPNVPTMRLGMERYRRELKLRSRNKVILFRGADYGILHVQEMALLTGVKLKERSPGVGTREEVLFKYGLSP